MMKGADLSRRILAKIANVMIGRTPEYVDSQEEFRPFVDWSIRGHDERMREAEKYVTESIRIVEEYKRREELENRRAA